LEEEILSVDSKIGIAKVFGMDIEAKPENIKVFVNGIDIVSKFRVETIKVIKED